MCIHFGNLRTQANYDQHTARHHSQKKTFETVIRRVDGARTRVGVTAPNTVLSTVIAANAPAHPRNTCSTPGAMTLPPIILGNVYPITPGATESVGIRILRASSPATLALGVRGQHPRARGAHQRPRVAHRKKRGDEECLVANLRGEDDPERLDKRLHKGSRHGCSEIYIRNMRTRKVLH